MSWLVQTLRTYPEIAIFIALAAGFWIGSLRFGKLKLGNVTGVLLAGVVVGQADVTISPNVKSVFFLMSLFAVGYGVGPQFFAGLKREGIPYALFALVLCAACLVSAAGAAWALGYDVGRAAGLLAGACTNTAALGVATDAIQQLERSPEEKKALLDSMPVAFAVTYLIGTAGAAWFLSSIGPKVLGGNLVQACKELEAKLGVKQAEPGVIPVSARFAVRSYRLTNPSFSGKTVAELEQHLASLPGSRRAFVEQIRRAQAIQEVTPATELHPNDILAVVGSRELLLEHHEVIGPEVEDRDVLQLEVEVQDVVITRPEIIGKTFKEILESPQGSMTRGVFLRKLLRLNQEIPLTLEIQLERGDVLQVVGGRRSLERSVQLFGYADRVTDRSNVLMLGLGIALGALVGSVSVKVGHIPLGLGTSGGALMGGLVCGWLRAVNRRFGRIPGPALWVFDNVGLTAFIAVVGITAGPGFFAGLKSAGLSLVLAGALVNCVPLLVGLLVGKYIFRFHPAINLGACAGARTTAASLGAIQDVCQSKVPSLGYTIPCAVGYILLNTCGAAIVAMLA